MAASDDFSLLKMKSVGINRVAPKLLVALLIRSVAPAQRNIGREKKRESEVERQRKHDLITKQEILTQSI